MSFRGLAAGVAATFVLCTTPSAFAVTQISWWHAMSGASAEVADKIVVKLTEDYSKARKSP